MTFIRALGQEDAFGKFIADTTTNKADLAGHYPYSPERWRYYRENGGTNELERVFIQYGDTTGFTDQGDYKEIDPAAGLVAKYSTAERFRYVVGYVTQISFAFNLNQALVAGETCVIGYGDPDLENDMANADGWFIEFSPNLTTSQCYFYMVRDGTIVSNGGSKTVVDLNEEYTNWNRYAIDFNWYGVGNATLTETFTDSSAQQINDELASISNSDGILDGRGPTSANKRVEFALQAAGTDNGIQMNVGSVSVIQFGDVDEKRRVKSFGFGPINIGTANTWVPAGAIRIDPDRKIVNAELVDAQILKYTASTKVQLIGKAFDASNVTFGAASWITPDELSPQNSVIEVRTDINQFADNTGTLQTTDDNPGGYQLTRAVLAPTDSQFKDGAAEVSGKSDLKRILLNGDILVMFVLAGSTGDIDFEIEFSEDW